MTARGPIAPGGPQRLPTRAGSPPWTPGTIRSRLDRPHRAHATYAYVGGAVRCHHHAGLLLPVISVITITGIGDHLQPEWLITFTGMRMISRRSEKLGQRAFRGELDAAGDRPTAVLPEAVAHAWLEPHKGCA
jgi:hypothetical protein